MFSTFNRIQRVRRPHVRLALAAALLFVCGATAARGQNTLNGFGSGSTGADGAFTPTTSHSHSMQGKESRFLKPIGRACLSSACAPSRTANCKRSSTATPNESSSARRPDGFGR